MQPHGHYDNSDDESRPLKLHATPSKANAPKTVDVVVSFARADGHKKHHLVGFAPEFQMQSAICGARVKRGEWKRIAGAVRPERCCGVCIGLLKASKAGGP